MNYSKNETRKRNKRKRQQFVVGAIAVLIVISIASLMISGIIHIFCCRCSAKVEAKEVVQNYDEFLISSEELESEPEPEIISLGEFQLTAYCACKKCCGKSDGITKTGTKATEGRTIAVDPRVIPLGSEVVIDGHKYIAEDVGGAVKGNKIDLYFDSHQEALEFGLQYKEVFMKGV